VTCGRQKRARSRGGLFGPDVGRPVYRQINMSHSEIVGLEHFWAFFLIGAMGGASVELLKLYEYRHTLSARKYMRLWRSPVYWAAILAMITVSGFTAWAVNASSSGVNPWQLVLTGIAARTLIREVASAKVASSPTTLGEAGEDDLSLSDLF
jgi:hypothetical protein